MKKKKNEIIIFFHVVHSQFPLINTNKIQGHSLYVNNVLPMLTKTYNTNKIVIESINV